MPALADGNLLGVFAKYWQPGTVKTRLARILGPENACEVYQAFVETLQRRMAAVEAVRQICFSPADREREFKEIAGTGWEIRPQSDGDLGQRMAHFFAQARQRGFQRVVLVGSDCPQLAPELVHRAFQLLHDVRVVVGPSLDGGYYLLGISGEIPDIFGGISWSSAAVCGQTLERLEAGQVAFRMLPPCYDVDEFEDLVRLTTDLAHENDLHLRELRDVLSPHVRRGSRVGEP